ncbi:unnamed protein product [Angiostrongylus costaricensis]|uniref:UDENN domain-containing protein n=1 Tax=Angiostrongylus costaricensis TaxID=334426 RepID=A0A0R3PUC6_ANGCS|nr:unnamed protein product [Angiostrongylus costaricensis]
MGHLIGREYFFISLKLQQGRRFSPIIQTELMRNIVITMHDVWSFIDGWNVTYEIENVNGQDNMTTRSVRAANVLSSGELDDFMHCNAEPFFLVWFHPGQTLADHCVISILQKALALDEKC